ncbi:MAG: terminase family protein [Acidobacteriia bacterium]|nr:terminase family protein [Terriglobia bacterium]
MGRSDPDVRTREINYQPLPSQKAFHNCQARFKGFSGPIGSGKSQALCHEAIRLSYLNPGRLGLLGAPTYPMLRDATQATLLEILAESGLPFEHNKAENTLLMRDTRSRILFRAVDEFERLRGTNLAWFGLDELTYTQEAAWLRLEGRLRDPKAQRLGGFAVWTPKGFDWVYRRFVADNRTPGYETIFAAPRENRFLLQRVPDFYERLKGSYDENFYKQEVLGTYLNLTGGLVYSAFTREQNVVDLEIDPYKPLLWTLDFNVDPMSSLIGQIAGKKIQVLDEIVMRRATTFQACEEFLKRFPRHEPGVIVYGDASGNREQTTGTSDYQMIREHFSMHTPVPVQYRVPKANPSVRERINLTNSKLRTACGDVELLVSPNCKELIKDLEQVSFREDGFHIDKDRDRERTHLSDALGYLLWQEFKAMPRVGEHRERLF